MFNKRLFPICFGDLLQVGRMISFGLMSACVSFEPAVGSDHPELRIDTSENLGTLSWSDHSGNWILELSNDLHGWAIVDSEDYERSSEGQFAYVKDEMRAAEFFRLREVGSNAIYVVGDSLSTPSTWPDDLEPLVARRIFSQAIGASQSPSMLARARGVEFVHPKITGNMVDAGDLELRWRRHVADRSHLERYRSIWPAVVKTVSEPTAIEVYDQAEFIGLAERLLKPVSTDYAAHPKTCFSAGHGLSNGDPVVFISNDPDAPDELSAGSPFSDWLFSSPRLPANVCEKRVYYATNVSQNSFDLLEYSNALEPLDLGGDALEGVQIECGWSFTVDGAQAPSTVTWKSRTHYDDWVWLLEVSANDIPGLPVSGVTIPNIERLIAQIVEVEKRFIIVCPVAGSYPPYGPDSNYWEKYYDEYMSSIRAKWPDRHLDTMALLNAFRSAEELSFLENSEIPELFWLRGDPNDPSNWECSLTQMEDSTQAWVGPGYTPLQFRANFGDRIHLNATANALIASELAEMLAILGW